MEEKKFVNFKKEELGVREYIKNSLGKGRISEVIIEYTPVGEKIVVSTNKPGLIIGRGGEKIAELTRVLKRRFHLDNPHIEIAEIRQPIFDAKLVADDIALMLERKGSLKFKVIAYKMLQEIMSAGVLGAEIVLSGRLPSERAKRWRFSQGYLNKTGEPAKIVHRAQSQATTQQGVVGVQISILHPDAILEDKIVVNDEMKQKIISTKLNIKEKASLIAEEKSESKIKKSKKVKKE